MDDGLSHAGLKCILEYLEANKRIFIAARSPVLRDFNKSIPLRLEKLKIDDSRVQINTRRASFSVSESSQDVPWDREALIEEAKDLTPGDIVITPKGAVPKQKALFCYLCFYGPYRYSGCDSPLGMDQRTAMKLVLDTLLGGYPYIVVDRMKFDECFSHILRLPTIFKIQPKSLIIKEGDISRFLPMIRSESLPLKELEFHMHSLEDLQLDIVKTAESLFINEAEVNVSIKDVFRIRNKHLKIDIFPGKGFLFLLNGWVRFGKTMGTTFEEILRDLKEDDHVVNNLKEKYKVESRTGDDGMQRHRCCVPSIKDVELHVFMEEFQDVYCRYREVRITLEVMPVGTEIGWEVSNV